MTENVEKTGKTYDDPKCVYFRPISKIMAEEKFGKEMTNEEYVKTVIDPFREACNSSTDVNLKICRKINYGKNKEYSKVLSDDVKHFQKADKEWQEKQIASGTKEEEVKRLRGMPVRFVYKDKINQCDPKMLELGVGFSDLKKNVFLKTNEIPSINDQLKEQGFGKDFTPELAQKNLAEHKLRKEKALGKVQEEEQVLVENEVQEVTQEKKQTAKKSKSRGR